MRDRQPHEGRTLTNDILIFISGVTACNYKSLRGRRSVS